jgi:hypothetical protein
MPIMAMVGTNTSSHPFSITHALKVGNILQVNFKFFLFHSLELEVLAF